MAKPEAAAVLLDAMGRHLLRLTEQGASPRVMAGIHMDLQAGALLVFMYESPTADDVLDCFDGAPLTYEYRRKFSNAPNSVKRYERTMTEFSKFLAEKTG